MLLSPCTVDTSNNLDTFWLHWFVCNSFSYTNLGNGSTLAPRLHAPLRPASFLSGWGHKRRMLTGKCRKMNDLSHSILSDSDGIGIKKTPFQYRDTTFPPSVLSNTTFGTTHWAINKSAWTLNRAHFLASCIHSLVSWMSLSGCWSFWSEIITSPLLGKLLIRQMSRFFTEPVDRLLCFARRLHLVTCKTPLLKTQFAPVRIAGTARLALAGRESWRKYPSARFKRFKGKLPGDCR